MSLSCLMLIIQAVTGYYLWWKKLRSSRPSAELLPEEVRLTS
jgi:uncharacterized iron-regulated membrane protein